MKAFKFFLLAIFWLCSFYSFSFIGAPSGDNNYLILETKEYRLIFDKSYLGSIKKVNQEIKNQIKLASSAR